MSRQERDVARKLAETLPVRLLSICAKQRIDPELFRTIPADLMFRYKLRAAGSPTTTCWSIAAADPGQVQMSDELPLLLGKKTGHQSRHGAADRGPC